MTDAIEALGQLFKGAWKPPAGFTAIPNSKRGGYRKRVGGKWAYAYPDEQGGKAKGKSPGMGAGKFSDREGSVMAIMQVNADTEGDGAIFKSPEEKAALRSLVGRGYAKIEREVRSPMGRGVEQYASLTPAGLAANKVRNQPARDAVATAALETKSDAEVRDSSFGYTPSEVREAKGAIEHLSRLRALDMLPADGRLSRKLITLEAQRTLRNAHAITLHSDELFSYTDRIYDIANQGTGEVKADAYAFTPQHGKDLKSVAKNGEHVGSGSYLHANGYIVPEGSEWKLTGAGYEQLAQTDPVLAEVTARKNLERDDVFALSAANMAEMNGGNPAFAARYESRLSRLEDMGFVRFDAEGRISVTDAGQRARWDKPVPGAKDEIIPVKANRPKAKPAKQQQAEAAAAVKQKKAAQKRKQAPTTQLVQTGFDFGGAKKSMDPIDALGALAKGLPFGKGKKRDPQDPNAQEDENDPNAQPQDRDGDGEVDYDEEDGFERDAGDEDEPGSQFEDDEGDEDEDDDEDDEPSLGDEGEPGEFGDEEDPIDDDGENHGVGDLDEDGTVESLVREVAGVERDYYAARGMHGAGHHKTDAMLDSYHRVVRKLVRTIVGGEGVAEGNDDSDESQANDGKPGFDANADDEGNDDRSQQQPGKAPPFGQKDQGEQSQGKAPPFGGKGPQQSAGKKPPPFGQGAGDEDRENDKQEQEKKKPNPFARKSVDLLAQLDLIAGELPARRDMVKSIHGFMGSEHDATLPARFLWPYLCAFIEAAYKSCCYDFAGQQQDANAISGAIMGKLVQLMPRNKNLAAAARKYSVTQQGIAKVLKDKGILTKQQTSEPIEPTGHDAMGAGNLAEEIIVRSWIDPDSLQKGPEGLATVSRHQQAAGFVDDRGDPFSALQKAQAAQRRAAWGVSEQSGVRATVNATCLIHGTSDMSKAQALQHHARCTCPRG